MNDNIVPFKKKELPKPIPTTKDGIKEILAKIKLIRRIVKHADVILINSVKHDYSKMREELDGIHDSFGNVVKLLPSDIGDVEYNALLRWLMESTGIELYRYQHNKSVAELEEYVTEALTYRDVCIILRRYIDSYIMIAMAYGQINERRVEEDQLQTFHDEVGREVFNFPKALPYFQDRTTQIQDIIENCRFGVLCVNSADKYRVPENKK